MINLGLREQLSQPLDGDRRFVRLEEGPFVFRVHPEHVATVMAEKARLRVQQDVAAFRRMMNRDGCRRLTGGM